MIKAAGLSALMALGTVAVATPAQAAGPGTVALGNYLQFKAASGKTNNLVVSRSGNVFTFDDTVSLKAGPGCKAVSGHQTVVTCSVANPGTVIITLGDKNDTFVNRTGLRFHAYGGSGNDKLTGGSGVDVLDGGTGNDKLYGNAGNDEFRGKDGNDLLDAGDGNDRMEAGAGNDTLVGRPGNDTILPDSGNDVVWAGAGDDDIYDPTKSTDVFHGGTGTDEVSYLNRTKPVVADLDGRTGDDGESGEKDTIDADVENLTGGRGNDRLTGNTAANVIDGYRGNDAISGGDGDDRLEGSPGKDTVSGGSGADRIYGGFEADTLSGGDGPDLIVGSAGNDKITGGAGDDELYGWNIPEIPDGGPPTEPDPYDDGLGGALDGGADNDLCLAGRDGTRTNCER